MNYQIKSLGYRTDFIFNRLDGSVEDKGDYIVARTKSNPNYFWGNLLLFKRPPTNRDLQHWKKLFRQEFKSPDIYHMTFAWDSPVGEEGDCSDFIAEGFELDKAVVLTCKSIQVPRKYNENISVSEISLNEHMDRCIDIQVDCADEDLSKESWRKFYTTSMNNYAELINQNHGKWFGAFIDKELVGTLGIFIDGDVGRFQIVSTHSSFQRRGVCSTLVYESAKHALELMG